MKNDYISSPHAGHGSHASDDELRLDHPPRGITAKRVFDGIIVIRIRMFSASAFGFLCFALFWNGFTSIFVCHAITMTAQKFGWSLPAFACFQASNKGSPSALWFLWLLLSPFIAIGLGSICMTVFQFFGRCAIHLGVDEGSVFTGIGPFGRTQRFSPQSVKSVDVKQSIITSTKRPTIKTNLVIEMNNGREIKFPGLGKIRETWLAFALGKLLRHA
ncbi:MAG: hypothetical protein FWH21_06150 [Kiritimatiellaeota bacterium]|nr:hypothetical protein [Kiritimatiellota bacterium]